MTTQPPSTDPDQPYGLGYVMPTPQRRRSRLPWIVTAVAVVIAAVGVGVAISSATGEDDEPSAAASPSTSASAAGPVRTITVGKRYLHVNDLRAAVESKTSVRCTSYEEIASPTGALQRAECTTDIVLSIYVDQEQAEATATEIGELVAGSLGTQSIHLVGENWTVNCGDDRALADELQAALGGELLISKSQ